MKRLLLTIAISLSLGNVARAQMMGIKTDVAADALLVPNLNVELVTGNKTSVNLEFMYAYHSLGTDLKAFVFTPEFRYWFGGRPMNSWFVGASLMGSTYKCTKEANLEDGFPGKVMKGNVGGAGVTFGYVWKLGKKNRWNLEFEAGIGMYRYHQVWRYPDVGENFAERSGSDNRFSDDGLSILPYKLGLSFSYIIPTELKKKKADKTENQSKK